MITAAEATQVLYDMLCTQEYTLTCTYTNCDYRDNPLLKTPVNQFKLDSTFNVANIQLGPAAEALTRS